MIEISNWTLKEAVAAIKNREISCSELTLASLDLAERYQPDINCFINIYRDDAMLAAKHIDNMGSVEHLPLAGIPLAHKDMYYRQGKVSTCGSESRQSFHASFTADVIHNLDHAGQVQIGTLNMAEFAFGATGHNHFFGACRNPWNTAYITGGSSSGSGAAVAAGIVFGALGSDTGGSIRIPAAACGLVGLKPTQGLISTHGMMPMSPSLDCAGPLARSSQDIALLMDVLAPDALPSGSSFADKVNKPIKGLRIGVPTNYYYDSIDGEIQVLLSDSLKRYEELGCEIVFIDVPDHDHLTSLSYIILGAETAGHHAEWLRQKSAEYGPQTFARLSAGFFLPATAYVNARQLRKHFSYRFIESVYSKCDVLHAPMLRRPLPTLDETSLSNDERMVAMITELSHCTRLTNYLGLPAISVPCGFSANGLPVGFQLIGKPYDERLLICLADWHEEVSGIRNQTAPLNS